MGTAWTFFQRMIDLAKGVMSSRGVQVGSGAALLRDVLNIDFFRRELVKIGPRSDPEALEQMARMIMTMLGLDGTPVVGPPKAEDWNYFTIDVRKARAFWHKNYYSRESTKGARRAGQARGFARGRADMARTAIVGKG